VQLLQQLLGSEEEALSLISRAPGILKLPVETKLQPVLTALVSAGLGQHQLAQLLQECPKLLGESKDHLVSRWMSSYALLNFSQAGRVRIGADGSKDGE